MSSDELLPKTAPLAQRLAVAMKRAGIGSQRELGLKLGHKDGSLVGKWLRGKVRRIESLDHQQALPGILDTPADYWCDPPPADLLAKLAETAVTTEDVLRLMQPTLVALEQTKEAIEFLAKGNRREALRVLSEMVVP